MKVGIVSDTHDDGDAVARAVERFSGENGADAVIHCGDVVAPFSATPFDVDGDEAFEFYCVRGNNDGEWKLRDTVEEFGAYLGEMGELELGARRSRPTTAPASLSWRHWSSSGRTTTWSTATPTNASTRSARGR